MDAMLRRWSLSGEAADPIRGANQDRDGAPEREAWKTQGEGWEVRLGGQPVQREEGEEDGHDSSVEGDENYHALAVLLLVPHSAVVRGRRCGTCRLRSKDMEWQPIVRLYKRSLDRISNHAREM